MDRQASGAGRLPARELIGLIRGLAGYEDSLLHRKLRGPMAAWGMESLLLRQMLLTLQGANWQRSGGKGLRPKPVPLPTDKKPPMQFAGGNLVQRLKNMGHIPG